jgi:flagellar hook assembly protein FlgD
VRIDIRDVSGRLVRQFARVHMDPGAHEIVWDARDDAGRTLAPGTYFFRLTVNGYDQPTTEKAILLR